MSVLSVVIPTRAEGAGLLAAVAALAARGGAGEIVIAAHGERAGVRRRLARCPRLTWVECEAPGRGAQLAAGARAARGEALLFLHADTRLPAGAAGAIARALADPAVAGGAFRLRFDAAHPALALLERLSALAWRGAFLGDQAMFCRRDAYAAAGGVPPWPLFEDVELARRLARVGRLVRLPLAATTSARRFVARGPWRQLAHNAALYARHRAGADPRALAREYGA